MSTSSLPPPPISDIPEGPWSDAQALHAALERLASSPAVITASGADGDPAGATGNGFQSISGAPPLVSWRLTCGAGNAAAFRHATHWAVHVPAPGPRGALFQAGDNRFDGVAFTRGAGGAPLLDGCATRFVCRRVHACAALDHLILIGEVIHLEQIDMPARSPHADRAAHEGGAHTASTHTPAGANATADSLGFLLGSAFFYMYGQLREAGGKMGYNNIEMFVIMALGERTWRSRREINALLFYGGHPTNLQVLDDLEASELLVSRTGASERPDDTEFDLTPGGQVAFDQFARVSAAIQQDMERLLGASTTATLRSLLRDFVKDTESARPVKWQ